MNSYALPDNLFRFVNHDFVRAIHHGQSYISALSETAYKSFMNNQISDLSVFQALLLLTILIISWKLLIYTINQLIGWVFFFLRLAVLTMMVASAWYIYTVGLDAFLQNLGWIMGIIDGFLVDGGTAQKKEKSWYSGR